MEGDYGVTGRLTTANDAKKAPTLRPGLGCAAGNGLIRTARAVAFRALLAGTYGSPHTVWRIRRSADLLGRMVRQHLPVADEGYRCCVRRPPVGRSYERTHGTQGVAAVGILAADRTGNRGREAAAVADIAAIVDVGGHAAIGAVGKGRAGTVIVRAAAVIGEMAGYTEGDGVR